MNEKMEEDHEEFMFLSHFFIPLFLSFERRI